MHTHYRTQGIFFKKENRAEADQVFSVFTKDFGRIEIIGKAIRKITSKLRSSADIFYFSEIEFIQGKAQKTLTDALTKQKFKNIFSSEENFETALGIASAFDALIVKEERDLKIWNLLSAVFQELNKAAFSGIIYHYFVWNLFLLLGYKPELYFCCLCRKKLLPETFYLSAQDGGIVCWQCFAKEKYELDTLTTSSNVRHWEFRAASPKSLSFSVNPEITSPDVCNWGYRRVDNQAKAIKVDTVKALRIFLKNPLKALAKMKLERENLEDLAQNTAFYFDFLKSQFSKPEKSDIITV